MLSRSLPSPSSHPHELGLGPVLLSVWHACRLRIQHPSFHYCGAGPRPRPNSDISGTGSPSRQSSQRLASRTQRARAHAGHLFDELPRQAGPSPRHGVATRRAWPAAVLAVPRAPRQLLFDLDDRLRA